MGRSNFDTCFYERYARAVLEKFCGSSYAELINSDRPDLQMEDGSVGIEVTRAMEPNKKAAMVMLRDLTGLGQKAADSSLLASLSDEDKEMILRSGYSYGVGDEALMGERDLGYWSLAQPLRKVIDSKIRKVDSGFYGHFQSYGLFVFCRYKLNDDEVRLIHRHVRQTRLYHNTVYQTVWLAFTDRLYICHIDVNHMESFRITRQEASMFFAEALNN